MKKLLTIAASFLFLYGCNIPLGTIPDIISDTNDTELVFMSPENNAKNIHGKLPVTFLWDKPLFTLQNPEVTQQFLEKNITITPEIEGSWQMLGTTGILFEPKTEWINTTRYEFRFTNNELTNQLKYGFETKEPEITNINAKDLFEQKPFELIFTEEMSLEEMKKSFVNPAMSFDLSYGETTETNKRDKEVTSTDKTKILFTPKSDWPLQTSYSVTLPKGAKTLHGNLPTSKDLSHKFKTISPFTLEKTNYPNSVHQGLNFSFSAPVSIDSFFDNIVSIAPNKEKGAEYLEKIRENLEEHHSSDRKGRLRFWLSPPGENWLPNIEYKFVIGKALTDIYGRKLGTDQHINFSSQFSDQVRSIHFPQHKSNVYRHGVTPTFSLWHTGKQNNVRVVLSAQYPVQSSSSQNLIWNESYDKQTIEEFDLRDFAKNEMLDENQNLKPGKYSFTVHYKNASSGDQHWTPSISSNFYITDFSIELKRQANSDAIVNIHSFPNEKELKTKTNAEIRIYDNNSAPRTINAIGTNFTLENISPYNSTLIIEKDGLLGIGGTEFNNGMNPYDAPVSYSPYEYQSNIRNVTFTDRPLFKPGDNVYFKSILRNTNFGKREFILKNVKPDQINAAKISITNSQYDEVYSSKLDYTNGSLDGFWKIPKNAPLGRYLININIDNGSTETSFFVTEYRKPDFLIHSEFDSDVAIWKDSLTAKLNAQYAFGGNLAEKKVNYSISLFGHKKNHWFWEPRASQDKVLVQDTTTLNSLGELEIPITLDFELDDEIDWSLLNFRALQWV